jgi:hypothetical protein
MRAVAALDDDGENAAKAVERSGKSKEARWRGGVGDRSGKRCADGDRNGTTRNADGGGVAADAADRILVGGCGDGATALAEQALAAAGAGRSKPMDDAEDEAGDGAFATADASAALTVSSAAATETELGSKSGAFWAMTASRDAISLRSFCSWALVAARSCSAAAAFAAASSARGSRAAFSAAAAAWATPAAFTAAAPADRGVESSKGTKLSPDSSDNTTCKPQEQRSKKHTRKGRRQNARIDLL